MKKSKLGCVVGSATLSPLLLGVVIIGGGTLLRLLGFVVWAPLWVILVIRIVASIALLVTTRNLYMVFFEKCYQTSQR